MVESFGLSRLPAVHFGAGMTRKAPFLARSFGRKLLLVTGERSFLHGGWSEKLISGLEASSVEYVTSGVSGEPVTSTIDKIVSEHRISPPDVILAVGGGSVLDTGKAVSAMLTVDGVVWDYMEGNPDMKAHPGTRLPLIAVPTTAGTGSEATKNSVLSTTGQPVLKRSLRHDNFVPDIAIVDPELTTGCPPDITAAGGLDALTQLLEAYVSNQSSELTDLLAYSGLIKGVKSLRRAFNNGDDIEARTGMSYAAFLSGIVLANAGLGAVHGFASVIGGHCRIPHGVICGTLLGAVTKANIDKLVSSGSGPEYLKKYSEAGRLFCAGTKRSDEYYLSCLTEGLDSLIEELAIPKLGIFGVKESDAEAIAEDTGIKNNPVALSSDELSAILISRL